MVLVIVYEYIHTECTCTPYEYDVDGDEMEILVFLIFTPLRDKIIKVASPSLHRSILNHPGRRSGESTIDDTSRTCEIVMVRLWTLRTYSANTVQIQYKYNMLVQYL